MTKVIVGGRASGKTTRMLEWMAAQAKDERRVCVTFSEVEADRLRRLARDLGLDVDDWQFVNPRHPDRLLGRSQLRLGVDNAELVLSAIFRRPVEILTVTHEPD